MLNIITADQLPKTQHAIAFLRALGGPTVIRLKGKNPHRNRAFCTLLHGNEPSGLQAVVAYLNSAQTPAVNTDIIIASVVTALTEPHFSHRMLPDRRDLNRCFQPPFSGSEGELAAAMLEFIQVSRPECLIDMHNTSGSGPAFAVAITDDPNHRALTSLWTNDLIKTDLRLGALMEQSEVSVPTVTIECGGSADQSSLMIAKEGLQRYFQKDQVLADEHQQYAVNCYHNPLRMELQAGANICFSELKNPEEKPEIRADVTLSADADRLNYGSVPAGEVIAWLGDKGLSVLSARDQHGQEQLYQHFRADHHQLVAKHPLKLFMVTTNRHIAQNDCLFYFIDCAHRSSELEC